MREFRRSLQGLEDLLSYDVVPRPGIVLGKSRMREHIASWLVCGPDQTIATAYEKEVAAARFNNAIRPFGDGWMLQLDVLRVGTLEYPSGGAFPDRVTRAIDEIRRQDFERGGQQFETVQVVTVTYQASSKTAQRLEASLLEDSERRERDLNVELLDEFGRKCLDFESQVRSIFPTVIRLQESEIEDDDGNRIVIDDQLSFYAFCVNGRRQLIRKLPPDTFWPISAMISSETFVGGNYPRIGDRYIMPIVVVGFPGVSFPALLNVINNMDTEYRFSTRFIFMDVERGKAVTEKISNKWQQKTMKLSDRALQRKDGVIDGDAANMQADAEQARSVASGADVKFGYYTATILLFGEDRDKTEDTARKIKKVLSELSLGARLDFGYSSENAVEAYLGTLPGNSYHNVRRPVLHTLNLAHLLPLSQVWVGPSRHPDAQYGPDAPPLIVARTEGGTPFRFFHHVGDVGHVNLIGGTGAGKSTFLQLMNAQHRRYPNAKIRGFDKGYSGFVLNQAAGGQYVEFDGAGWFAPLRKIDTTAGRARALAWIEGIYELQDVPVTPTLRRNLDQSLERLAQAHINDRSISHFLGHAPYAVDVLGMFCINKPGEIMDGYEDDSIRNSYQIGEMDSLLSRGDLIASAVLLYMFNLVEDGFDGSPTLFNLDEGWIFLNKPNIAQRVDKALREWRKKRASVIFSTQGIAEIADLTSDVGKSVSIKHVLRTNAQTQIFLPNPNAVSTIEAQMYRSFGLSDGEIEAIALGINKRDYFYKSTLGKRMIRLGLTSFELALVGAGGVEDVALAKRLVEEFGQEKFAEKWFQEKGVKWPDYQVVV